MRLVGGELDHAVAGAGCAWCAGSRRPGRLPAPRNASIPRGSGARPPTRNRSRACRPTRSGSANPAAADTRWSGPEETRKLVLVEDSELHGLAPMACPRKRRRRGRSTWESAPWENRGPSRARSRSLHRAPGGRHRGRPRPAEADRRTSEAITKVGTLIVFRSSTRSPEAITDRYWRAAPCGHQRRSTFFSTKARISSSGVG